MLDNCSQGTFLNESINKKLDISVRMIEITVKTLNGKQNMASTLVTGLKVSKNVYGERVRWLKLPATYTRDLLADAEEVATQEKVRKWEQGNHSRQIADRNQYGDWIAHRSKLFKSIRTIRSASK